MRWHDLFEAWWLLLLLVIIYAIAVFVIIQLTMKGVVWHTATRKTLARGEGLTFPPQ